MSALLIERPSPGTRLPPSGEDGLAEAPLIKVRDTGSAIEASLARTSTCNAISLDVIQELDILIRRLTTSGTERPFVLRGSGRWFSSGGDLRQFSSFTSDDAAEMAVIMADVLRAIERLPGPTIAALNGPAIGGGVELALAFDFRVASASSYLKFAQTRIGITTGWQGIERLCALVGYSTALYLLLTAATVGPEDALRLGLVNAVWPDNSFDAELDILVNSLVESGDAGIAMKRILRAGIGRCGMSSGELEQQLMRALWDRPRRRAAMTDALGADKKGR